MAPAARACAKIVENLDHGRLHRPEIPRKFFTPDFDSRIALTINFERTTAMATKASFSLAPACCPCSTIISTTRSSPVATQPGQLSTFNRDKYSRDNEIVGSLLHHDLMIAPSTDRTTLPHSVTSSFGRLPSHQRAPKSWSTATLADFIGTRH
jgi:hypothetical protein